MHKRLKELTEADDPQLKKLSQQFGYTYEPHGFIIDEHLNVDMASCWMYDWMHSMLIEGVFVKEVRTCNDKLEADDDAPAFGRSTFEEYISMFATPKAYPSGTAVFEQNTPDGSASEWLSACPIHPQAVYGGFAPHMHQDVMGNSVLDILL